MRSARSRAAKSAQKEATPQPRGTRRAAAKAQDKQQTAYNNVIKNLKVTENKQGKNSKVQQNTGQRVPPGQGKAQPVVNVNKPKINFRPTVNIKVDLSTKINLQAANGERPAQYVHNGNNIHNHSNLNV